MRVGSINCPAGSEVSRIPGRTFASALRVPVQGVIRAVRVAPTVLDGRVIRISVVGARQDSAVVLKVRLEQDLLAGIPDAIAVVPLARHTAQRFMESKSEFIQRP